MSETAMTATAGRLAGKVAMATASTRGIGYAIVKRFAEEGATVYMAARNAERAQGKIDQLAQGNLPGTVKFVYNDASKDETYVSAVEEVVANEGRIDVLVNNFGTSNGTAVVILDQEKVTRRTACTVQSSASWQSRPTSSST